MKRRKIIIILIVLLLVGSGILDAARYLKPDATNKTVVRPTGSPDLATPTKIIFVYNANGGIYPGLADIIHKEFFPKSYPCNLCYQAFGTFGKKEGWTNFLNTIPFQKVEFHKDDFNRQFQYDDELPLILIADDKTTAVLVTAAELNTAKSLEELISIVKAQLAKYKI